MSDLKLTNIGKSFGKVEVLHGIDADHSLGRVRRAARRVGLRQDDVAADRGGAGQRRLGHGRDRRQRRHRPAARGAGHRHDVPELRVAAAHVRCRERALPAADATPGRPVGTGRPRPGGAGDGAISAHLAERMPRQFRAGSSSGWRWPAPSCRDPKVLLLDEPLSNLDARLREEMQVELIDIHRRIGLTTLFVTHDQDEALSLADRVVLMNAGGIEQEAPPREIYDAPATAYASSFLGAANLLPAEISAGLARLADGQTLAVPAGTGAGAATLALRQENIDYRARRQPDRHGGHAGLSRRPSSLHPRSRGAADQRPRSGLGDAGAGIAGADRHRTRPDPGAARVSDEDWQRRLRAGGEGRRRRSTDVDPFGPTDPSAGVLPVAGAVPPSDFIGNPARDGDELTE